MSPNQPVKPDVTGFFDPATNTISYVVADPQSASCAIIDSVLDFDYASGAISYQQADQIIEFVTANQLKPDWLIETHVHADHLSAAPYLQESWAARSAFRAILPALRIFLARSSMPAPNFSAMAASLTSCLRMETAIR